MDIVSFADKTTVLCKCDNLGKVKKDTNRKLKNINNWLIENKLLLDSEKTHLSYY